MSDLSDLYNGGSPRVVGNIASAMYLEVVFLLPSATIRRQLNSSVSLPGQIRSFDVGDLTYKLAPTSEVNE